MDFRFFGDVRILMASHLGKGFPPDRPPTQSKPHILRKEFNTEAAARRFQVLGIPVH